MPERDYKALYRFQDKFLSWYSTLELPFYLTGGTALGRYFLNHRYSEDLDFFTNANPGFTEFLAAVRYGMIESFDISPAEILITDDFARFFVSDGELKLKIDFVNDVEKYVGKKISSTFGYIDNPLNILTNKLSALVGRDEPKDFFDILKIANTYSYNWKEVFLLAKEKALLNELEISEKISTFRVEQFSGVDWLIDPLNFEELSLDLKQLNDDFLLGRDNSIGMGKPSIAQIDTAGYY